MDPQAVQPGAGSKFIPIRPEPEVPGEHFASDLANVLRDVSNLQRKSAAATQALVRGEPIDLHEVLIRQEEARIAFSLLIETRNKVLDAYHEIMRMSV
jgi:flagellar hook-basal body complex protein FliE